MGLGKTIQTIAFISELNSNNCGPILILCPLTVLEHWISEIEKCDAGLKYFKYYGSKEERYDLAERWFDFIEVSGIH